MKLTRGKVMLLGAGAVALFFVTVAMRPKVLDVETALVARGPLEATIDADGRARVRQRYVIVAPVAGRVARLTLREGAAVRAGDVVARIAPLPLDEQSITQARARIDAALALSLESAAQVRIADDALAQRKRELSRALRLGEVGGVSPRTIEEAELAARAAIEQASSAAQRAQAADAGVREARAVLHGVEGNRGAPVLVRAPARGRVLRVPEASERIVAAGTPLIEVGDAGSLEFVIDVLSSEAALIAPGAVVRLDSWGGDGETALAGRVRDVEPSAFTKVSALGVEEQRVNIIVDAPDCPEAVGDGFRVEARIVIWTAANAVSVPASALLRPSATTAPWSAFVVRAGRIEQRQVTVGHLAGERAEVIDGLQPGEQVVVFPSDEIVPGLRVRARMR